MKNDLKLLKVKNPGGEQIFHGSWYRGKTTKFIPNKVQLKEDDAIDRFIVDGWAKPGLIGKDNKILSFGSCLARHVTNFLHKKGFSVLGREKVETSSHIIRFGEGIVNTFSILQQLQWAIEGKNFDHLYWFGPNKEIALPGEEERRATRDLILEADTFILTLGVSEIWYDKVSGEAFWRAIPAELFDENRHGFRISTVEENVKNIAETIKIIRKTNPCANVIVTVSPVPLMATFRNVSCISASSVSKAILRVAVDEVVRAADENVHYFPSYEIVKEFFVDPFLDDNRHPKPEVIDTVMQAFERNFLQK